MHFRRLACFLIGAWLSGSIFMALMAAGNFRAVERILSRPPVPVALQIRSMGYDSTRAILRYQVSEQNRSYFETWELTQLALGSLLLFVLLFGSTESKLTLGLAALMLMAVVLERVLLTPELVSLGRAIDFLPPGAQSPERARFWGFHWAYSTVEAVKCAAALALGARLILRSRRPSAHAVDDFHLIDKADHGHVNG